MILGIICGLAFGWKAGAFVVVYREVEKWIDGK
jgi:hypothetical protein